MSAQGDSSEKCAGRISRSVDMCMGRSTDLLANVRT